MSNLLFQLTLLAYGVTTAVYLVFFFSDRAGLRGGARCLFIGGATLHSATILARLFEAGHTPITSQHETVSFFAWSIAVAYLSFRWRYTVKNLGTFVSGLTFLFMVIAALASSEMSPLPPALQSIWLPIHASVAVAADGFLALAFVGSVMYLLQERELKRKHFGLIYSRLPSLDSLDTLNHHCLTIGFSLMTLGIVTGSIWAKQAWGAYWHWDPKETWSLITWLLYAGLLHQRLTIGWRGRRAAIMTIIGFAAVLFTLWGVNYLLGGVHSYAG